MRYKFNIWGFSILCIGILCFSTFSSCKSSIEAEAKDTEIIAPEEMQTNVDFIVLQTSDFTREMISNGKLRAKRKSRLSFSISEELVKLNIANGQSVKAGEILAILNTENLERQKLQAEIRLYRARMDLEDILIGRGFTLKDSLKVPKETMQMASVRSGYAEAFNDFQRIISDIKKAKITAPYNGIIADIDAHVHEHVNAGKDFCIIIDNTAFLVEFTVMESELPFVEIGKSVEIIPFSNPENTFSGIITGINPVINENGQTKVVALIQNTESLKEGMNVKVVIKEQIPNQLIVPKSAVMYRDNLEVLFRYVNGKAYWTYVITLWENSSFYAVKANPNRTASLNTGDTVIVSNNINLAHGSRVRLN
ncbi:MAG: efflux RND transporter periplasmic adaptor subunit [Bacteroidetes bacterium]|nr:efflux RND transporter periplasmic adaptor subunit [Bacteroidota bacterium]